MSGTKNPKPQFNGHSIMTLVLNQFTFYCNSKINKTTVYFELVVKTTQKIMSV
jgi:hypothetical protein